MELTRTRSGAVALALTGLLALSGAMEPAAAQSPGAAPAGAASGPVVPVAAASVVRQDVPVWLRGLGSVQALNSVLLRTRVDGTLTQVPVIEGQDVKQGDLLAVIDPRPYQALLDAAQAKQQQDRALLANAQADLARYGALVDKSFSSRQQFETQQSLVKQITAMLAGDAAQIASAQLNLVYSYITAPFDGRVGLRTIDAGNFVRAAEATPIMSLAQIRPIAVTFTLPQDMLPIIQDAMSRGKPKVAAFASDDRTRLDEGTLMTIDNAIDPTTGTIKLKASFANAAGRLWPGQFVHMRLLASTEPGVLTVPTPAVLHGPNGLYVYVVKPDSTVSRQPVEITRDDGRLTIIAKGLDEGQSVVLDGQSRLQAGTRVTISGGAKAAEASAAKTGG